jgi:hypothetical protein
MARMDGSVPAMDRNVTRLRHMTRFAVLAVVALLAACGEPTMTARDAIDVFTAADLPAPDPRDVTDTACAETGCAEAVATDVVTVFRWQDSSQALAHAADLRQPAYSLDEFVIAFPVDTEVDTARYATALQEATSAEP